MAFDLAIFGMWPILRTPERPQWQQAFRIGSGGGLSLSPNFRFLLTLRLSKATAANADRWVTFGAVATCCQTTNEKLGFPETGANFRAEGESKFAKCDSSYE